MPHLSPLQIRKLGSYPLSRDGVDLEVARGLNCANFALNGSEIGMADARSPDSIYSSNGVGQNPINAILEINPFTNVCSGLKATAIPANHPGCEAEINTLNLNINNALGGNVAAQNNCAEAMVKIVARKNGLEPGVLDDKYQLHMKGTTWFGWDHWALSIRPEQMGRPRIFIQTVTGKPLSHACDVIWDEHLNTSVTLNLTELHNEQILLINGVNYCNFCFVCKKTHGFFPSSPINAWHKCTTCATVYCPVHGQTLSGKQGLTDRTRKCGRIPCSGRTEIVTTL